jgi:hypothetical protein
MSFVEKLFSVIIRLVLLGAFASFLLASIHHFATFFHNFEPSSVDMAGPYALAFSIDGTALVLTIGVMFFSSRMTWPAKVLIWTFIILLTGFSWVVNWEYAQVYQGATFNKLDPFWQTLNPILASSFAFLNLAYSIIAEVFNTKEKSEAELRAELSALTGDKAELIRQIRAAKGPSIISRLTEAAKEIKTAAGEVLNSDQPAPQTEQKPEEKQQPAAPENTPAATPLALPEPMTEKLKLAYDALVKDPAITDEQLAKMLGLNRAASARFWRLKAIEILASQQPVSEPQKLPDTEPLANVNEEVSEQESELLENADKGDSEQDTDQEKETDTEPELTVFSTSAAPAARATRARTEKTKKRGNGLALIQKELAKNPTITNAAICKKTGLSASYVSTKRAELQPKKVEASIA